MPPEILDKSVRQLGASKALKPAMRAIFPLILADEAVSGWLTGDMGQGPIGKHINPMLAKLPPQAMDVLNTGFFLSNPAVYTAFSELFNSGNISPMQDYDPNAVAENIYGPTRPEDPEWLLKKYLRDSFGGKRIATENNAVQATAGKQIPQRREVTIDGIKYPYESIRRKQILHSLAGGGSVNELMYPRESGTGNTAYDFISDYPSVDKYIGLPYGLDASSEAKLMNQERGTRVSPMSKAMGVKGRGK